MMQLNGKVLSYEYEQAAWLSRGKLEGWSKTPLEIGLDKTPNVWITGFIFNTRYLSLPFPPTDSSWREGGKYIESKAWNQL